MVAAAQTMPTQISIQARRAMRPPVARIHSIPSYTKGTKKNYEQCSKQTGFICSSI